MKGIALKITLVIAASLIAALPVLAADMGSGTMGQDNQNSKDECLLMARNCGDQSDTIQQRIQRINRELNKGSAVYSTDELRHLQNQLDDANHMMEILNENSGA
ncbi:hypothetical protein GMLC_23230 [Geomonas limicola]|uniref:Uncharacterized protein n=1 Tax=Geomonas limicola TaxID=2740186 RepID=A0A6V8NA33_9BACT|nr:hypothetical protein [Geomonas limicola]GFO68744.1 hypothetical protein GMLC_23230 [Geomonas limicola]